MAAASAPESVIEDNPGTVARRGSQRGRTAAAVAASIALLVVGYSVGLRSSWSAHQPTIASGKVERVLSDTPWAMFTPDNGGEQVEFYLEQVAWHTDKTTGSDSVPPCLRAERASVTAEVGMIEVARPFGSGSYWKVLSLWCP